MAKKKSIAELGALALKQLGSPSFYDKKAGPMMKRGRPSGSKNKIVLAGSTAIVATGRKKTSKRHGTRSGGDLETLRHSASIINKAKNILDGVGCITAFGKGHKKVSEPVVMHTGTHKKAKKAGSKKGPGRPKKK